MTIPASDLVQVIPSVLGVSGAAIDVVGLVLTNSTRIPTNTVQSFPDAQSVQNWFGAGSSQATLAGFYFGGFDGSTVKPATMRFAQFNSVAVAGYLKGGNVASLTLAQLQAITGTLIVAVDGVTRNAAALNLSAATSFSSAAGIIQTALNAGGANPTIASLTGVIASGVLTASAVTGTIAPGQQIVGAGISPGVWIVSQLTGTPGGAGTYQLSSSITVGSEAMTTNGVAVVVTYDSTWGSFVITSGITGAVSTVAFATGTTSAALALTSVTGAVLSQGAAIQASAAQAGSFMNNLILQNLDWVTFMTDFDPDGSGFTVKQALATWKNTQNSRYAYVAWDTDQSPVTQVPANASFGAALAAANDSGTCLLDGETSAGWSATAGAQLAALVCGMGASINFNEPGGRITFAYKGQTGFVATVVDEIAGKNLAGDPQTGTGGNGYNFYGAYAQATTNFVWFQRGLVTGPFKWLDSYINQVWLNANMQLALLQLFQNAKSIPYTGPGMSLIQSALADPIQAGLTFGAFAPGRISASQIAAVNAAAGANIANTLQTQGYYLQVLQPSSSVRAARGSPICKFWYLDRGSVQAITLSSTAVQ